MSNIVQFNPQSQLPAAISQHLQQSGGELSGALSEGVGASYANVSFKGKVFRIKYNGQETMLVDPNNPQMALQYLDVVIIDAKGPLSKTFYVNGYVEGVAEQPDCASEDGITPFAPVGKQVQSATCAMCPWNAFGSKISADGKGGGGKACADTRKIAVVPAGQYMANERFGGPMLLRIPADSLKNLAQFSNLLKSQGAPFFAAVCRITFDMNAPHPKLVFTPLRYLDDNEAQIVMGLRAHPTTHEIVAVNTSPVGALPPPAQQIPGQVPSQLQQAPVTQTPVVNSAPTTAPAPVAQYAPPTAQVPPPIQQPQQYAQQPQQAAQLQTASFGEPTPPPAPPQAVQAPGIPQTGQPYQPPAPVQQFAPPPQQAAPPQQPPQQYAPPVQQAAPPQQYAQPQQMQPPPVAQVQQFAPPAQQPQASQFAPAHAPQAQPLQGNNQPINPAVLSTVDALLG